EMRECEKIAGRREVGGVRNFVWSLFLMLRVYVCVWIMWITFFCERDSSSQTHTSIWRVVKRPTERITTRGNMYRGDERGPNLHPRIGESGGGSYFAAYIKMKFFSSFHFLFAKKKEPAQ
ncbi:hypothetical protein COCCADRAFT_107939, partial [Bipolaris zeicola 26-R-13]